MSDERLQSFNKIYSVSCFWIYNKKQSRHEEQAEQTHNHLESILVFACDSYLFCAAICWVMERRNQSLNIIRVVKYEYSYDEYFKYWIWVERGSMILK